MSGGDSYRKAYRNFLKLISDDSTIQEENDWMEEQLNNLRASAQMESSTRRPREVVHRDREGGECNLLRDYFVENPVYPAHTFRRRFRMSRQLFLRVVEGVKNHSDFFQQRHDALGRKGFSALQKCTAAIRQLAYGSCADQVDEYLRMSEQVANQCLVQFCQAVKMAFGPQYLRKPKPADVARLLALHEDKHGFPGMLGSLDCMHWKWKNCPVAWKGAYTRGDQGAPTIILEAVASQDLWIWHAFFGLSGARNDINVLNESPLYNDAMHGHAPEVNYTINGTEYSKAYYLTDGIYPEWATFVKSFQCPTDEKRRMFKRRQEAAIKDIERAFGVLQARWAILSGPARGWYKEDLGQIMLACIILHNMIIENEGEDVVNWQREDGEPEDEWLHGAPHNFQQYLQRRSELRDKQTHHQLRNDLIEHIWNESNHQG